MTEAAASRRAERLLGGGGGGGGSALRTRPMPSVPCDSSTTRVAPGSRGRTKYCGFVAQLASPGAPPGAGAAQPPSHVAACRSSRDETMSTSKSSSKDSAISSTSTQKSRALRRDAAGSGGGVGGGLCRLQHRRLLGGPPKTRRPIFLATPTLRGYRGSGRGAAVARLAEAEHGVQPPPRSPCRPLAPPPLDEDCTATRLSRSRAPLRRAHVSSSAPGWAAPRGEAGQVDEALAGVAAAARRRVAQELGVALLQQRREALSGGGRAAKRTPPAAVHGGAVSIVTWRHAPCLW